MQTPIKNLLMIQEVLQDGAVDPLVADWFDRGVEAYLCRQAPLDVCLGLAGGQGKRKALTKFLFRQRNHHLKQAWLALDETSPWKRSIALVAETNRFEAILWPRWRNRSDPPGGCSDLRRELFHAYKTGCTIPTGTTQLHAICNPMNGKY